MKRFIFIFVVDYIYQLGCFILKRALESGKVIRKLKYMNSGESTYLLECWQEIIISRRDVGVFCQATLLQDIKKYFDFILGFACTDQESIHLKIVYVDLISAVSLLLVLKSRVQQHFNQPRITLFKLSPRRRVKHFS